VGTAVGASNLLPRPTEFVSSFVPADRRRACGAATSAQAAGLREPANGLQAPDCHVDKTKGDDFAANVNEGKATRPRVFSDGHWHGHRCGDFYSTRSMRPNLSGTDGLGTYAGTMQSGSVTAVASLMLASPKAMSLDPAPAQCIAIRCSAQRLQGIARIASMNWELGGIERVWHWPRARGTSLAPFYHSSPTLAGNPD